MVDATEVISVRTTSSPNQLSFLMNSAPRKGGLDFKIQKPTQLLYEKRPTHLLKNLFSLSDIKDPNKSNTQKYFRHSNVEKIRIGAIEIWVFHLFWPFRLYLSRLIVFSLSKNRADLDLDYEPSNLLFFFAA